MESLIWDVILEQNFEDEVRIFQGQKQLPSMLWVDRSMGQGIKVEIVYFIPGKGKLKHSSSFSYEITADNGKTPLSVNLFLIQALIMWPGHKKKQHNALNREPCKSSLAIMTTIRASQEAIKSLYILCDT